METKKASKTFINNKMLMNNTVTKRKEYKKNIDFGGEKRALVMVVIMVHHRFLAAFCQDAPQFGKPPTRYRFHRFSLWRILE
jgi:hypothetical protein